MLREQIFIFIFKYINLVKRNLKDTCEFSRSMNTFKFHLKEGNVLFNNALNTFYLRLYGRKEGNVLFNDTLNTFYYGYTASDIWQGTTQIVRKETCCRHIIYSF